MTHTTARRTAIDSIAAIVSIAMIAAIASIASFFFSSCNTPSDARDTSSDDESPARVLYFDSVGGSADNTGLSELSPLKEMTALNGMTLGPGDEIRLKSGGAWEGPVYLKGAGTADSPITVTVWGEGTAPELCTTTEKKPALTVLADHVAIVGLHVTGAVAAAGIYFGDGVEGVTVRDCEIERAGVGVSVRGSDHAIEGCNIHDLTMMVDTAGGDDDYGAIGVFLLNAARVRIEGNRFTACKAPSHDYGSDGGVLETWGSAKDIEFSRNYSEGNNGFYEVGGPNGETVENVRVHHNISVNDMVFFLPHLSGSFAVTIKRVEYSNNTFYCDAPLPYAAFVAHGYSMEAGQLSAINNAIISANKAFDLADGGFDHRGNLYFGLGGADPGVGPYLHATERVADPGIGPISAAGYSFLAGSALVDAGVPVDYGEDYAGSPAPVNGAHDIGAIERR